LENKYFSPWFIDGNIFNEADFLHNHGSVPKILFIRSGFNTPPLWGALLGE